MTFTLQFSIIDSEPFPCRTLDMTFPLWHWCHSYICKPLNMRVSLFGAGSIALLLTAPFAKRCLLLQDVDLSPFAFHFFFALPCVGEMTSACKSMKCTSRSRAALARSRSRGAQALDSAPAPPSVLLCASSRCAKLVQMH